MNGNPAKIEDRLFVACRVERLISLFRFPCIAFSGLPLNRLPACRKLKSSHHVRLLPEKHESSSRQERIVLVQPRCQKDLKNKALVIAKPL